MGTPLCPWWRQEATRNNERSFHRACYRKGCLHTMTKRSAIVLLVAGLGLITPALTALGQEVVQPGPIEHHDIKQWISAHCCVTNNCCYKIAPSEVRPLPNDEWLINATGQTIKRTDWSRDGNYWRCSCKCAQVGSNGFCDKWAKPRRDDENTRCLYVPQQFSRSYKWQKYLQE